MRIASAASPTTMSAMPHIENVGSSKHAIIIPTDMISTPASFSRVSTSSRNSTNKNNTTIGDSDFIICMNDTDRNMYSSFPVA